MVATWIVLLMLSFVTLAQYIDDDLRGNYCSQRRPERCCSGRNDQCTTEILGTQCYCDMFCDRINGADCCPDFWAVCRGVPPPEPIIRQDCFYRNKYYKPDHILKNNCNKCKCTQKNAIYEFQCEESACLVRPDLIESINSGDFGWRAENYTFLWGKTFQDGIIYRLGTFKPIKTTMDMTEIHMISNGDLPEAFDSRDKWPGLIQPIRDQGDCGASWAFSTTALASDRLAIESGGNERMELSPQQLLSCQRRGQEGCLGGHLDKAWYYLRKKGVATEKCFPYTSGTTGKEEDCPLTISTDHQTTVNCPTGKQDMLYHSTPPYRVGPNEEEIMHEIYMNGPVQATFRVHEDFFSYKSGVYKHIPVADSFDEAYKQHGWHSVRIIGWGVQSIGSRPVKYWLCANTWGSQWGEDGYFRIVKGQDECDIEMFVVGVWANRNSNGIR